MAQELNEATAQIELSSASAAIALEIESNPQSQQWPMEQWGKWLIDNSFDVEQITNELSQGIGKDNNKHWSKNAYVDIKNELSSNQTLEQLQSAIQEGKHPALEQLLRSVKNSQINNDKLLSTSGGGKGVRWIDHHPGGDTAIVAAVATLATLGYKKYQNRQNAGERADGIEQQLEQDADRAIHRSTTIIDDSTLDMDDIIADLANNKQEMERRGEEMIKNLRAKEGTRESFYQDEDELGKAEPYAKRELEITSRQTKDNIQNQLSNDIQPEHEDTNNTTKADQGPPRLELNERFKGDPGGALKAYEEEIQKRYGDPKYKAQQDLQKSKREGETIAQDSEQRVDNAANDIEADEADIDSAFL